MSEALRPGHEEERQYHEEVIPRFQAEYTRLPNRIGAMDVDKHDARVDTVLLDRKVAEWRAEQVRRMRATEAHQATNWTYLEEGIRLPTSTKAHEHKKSRWRTLQRPF